MVPATVIDGDWFTGTLHVTGTHELYDGVDGSVVLVAELLHALVAAHTNTNDQLELM